MRVVGWFGLIARIRSHSRSAWSVSPSRAWARPRKSGAMSGAAGFPRSAVAPGGAGRTVPRCPPPVAGFAAYLRRRRRQPDVVFGPLLRPLDRLARQHVLAGPHRHAGAQGRRVLFLREQPLVLRRGG